ncbi:MAG: hypothetical protein KC609_05545 [Myxococcales bacterium]|nr:hypothetical protein [Myxococcales bacterium]
MLALILISLSGFEGLRAQPKTHEERLSGMWRTLRTLDDPLGRKRTDIEKQMVEVAQRCRALIISKSMRPRASMVTFCARTAKRWRCGQPDDAAHLTETSPQRPVGIRRTGGLRLRTCHGSRVLRVGLADPRALHGTDGFRHVVPLTRDPSGRWRIPRRAVKPEPQLLMLLLRNRNHVRKLVWVVRIVR